MTKFLVKKQIKIVRVCVLYVAEECVIAKKKKKKKVLSCHLIIFFMIFNCPFSPEYMCRLYLYFFIK